jgi:hypothetical protein
MKLNATSLFDQVICGYITCAAHLIIFDIRCFNLTSVLSMVKYDNDPGGALVVKVELIVGR